MCVCVCVNCSLRENFRHFFYIEQFLFQQIHLRGTIDIMWNAYFKHFGKIILHRNIQKIYTRCKLQF